MRTYWDTSALLDVILDIGNASHSFRQTPERITRCHTLAETFSQLTGGKLGFRMLPIHATLKIAELASAMTVLSLTPEQTLAALTETNRRGVRGGAIHDFLHVYAAEIHDCVQIVTGNLSDFQRLTTLKVIAP